MVSQQLLSRIGTLALRQRVYLRLIFLSAFRGQRRENNGVVLCLGIITVVVRASSRVCVVTRASLQPHLARNGIPCARAYGSITQGAFSIVNPLRLRPCHVPSSRLFVHKHCSALHVGSNKRELSKVAVSNRVDERPREEATCLAQHTHGVAIICIVVRNYQPVVLAGRSSVLVFFTVSINPRLTQVESIRTRPNLATIRGLDRLDSGHIPRRDGLILVHPLHVHLSTIWYRVVAVCKSRWSATVNLESTSGQSVRSIGGASLAFDVTVGDCISFNSCLASRTLSGGCWRFLGHRCRCGLRLHNDGAGGSQSQHSTSGRDGLHAVVLKAEGLSPETSTDGTSAQVRHELSPFRRLL